MTNKIALALGLFIFASIVLDLFFYGPQHMIFLGKKMNELIEWLAFWR